MIYAIDRLDDPLLHLINSDPVRPHISIEKRVDTNAQVLVLMDESNIPQSVVCVSFLNYIPTCEEQLFDNTAENTQIAVLYTIWSLQPGGGQAMVSEALNWIKNTRISVSRVITLSPHTPTARRFHLKNGAKELQKNATTVNFEYPI